MPHRPSSNSNHYAATAASTTTAIMFGHPWDTVSKRLQVNTGAANMIFLRQAIRKPYAGLGWAAGYKAVQWGGKLAAFKPVKYQLGRFLKEPLNNAMGPTGGKYALAGLSGAIVGSLEACVVLPVDSMKVLKQTNPDAIKGNSVKFFTNNYLSLYRGLTATIARNAPGSALLLGGTDIGRQMVEQHNKGNSMSFFQNLLVSSSAAFLSIGGTYPVDLIKTRMQSDFGGQKSMRETVLNIARSEGISGFWRGIVPKLSGAGPKLALQMVVFNFALDYLEKRNEKIEDHDSSNRPGLGV
jgi:hypothetical protein